MTLPHTNVILRYPYRLRFDQSVRAGRRGKRNMKQLIHAGVAVLSAGVLLAVTAISFAQNTPGVPGGILNDSFRLQEHPQMQFAASAPTKKYQKGRSELRKKGDLGDPDGCNLKCPQE